jgi:hypothetical protein
MLDHTYIPLAGAYLCSDCNVIGVNSRTCARCCSTALLALSRVIPVDHGGAKLVCHEENRRLPEETWYIPACSARGRNGVTEAQPNT